MDRRTFLQTAGAAAAGVVALGPLSACARAPMTRFSDRLGVQLYTVRDVLPDDFAGVLREIRRIGYEEVQFAGYHGRSPSEVRGILDDAGLSAPAAHVGLGAIRDDLDAQLEAAAVVGHDYLVVPWLPVEERDSLDRYRRLAAEFNEVGERTRAAGIKLAYHNHDYVFETFGGQVPGYDVLIQETDPELVAMEMDLFWTVHGGADPIDYFERYPGRFHLVHVKDRTAGGEMVDVGAGDIDFARIFAHAELAGIRHAFVEHDNPADSLASIRASYQHLAGLRIE
jgi:sugar phosphate isomerase/epimerase